MYKSRVSNGTGQSCLSGQRDKKFFKVIKLLPSVDDSDMHKVRILNTNSEAIDPEFTLERTLSVDQLLEGQEVIDPDVVTEIFSKEDLKRLWNNKA